jgi:hypothetical protein
MGGVAKTVKKGFKSITPSFLGGNAGSVLGHRAWADVKRTGRALDDSGITAAAAGYVVGGPAGAVTAYGIKKQRDAMGNLVSSLTPDDAAAQPVMPTADDDELARARKRSIAEQLRRSGRQSTILTDGDQLGG